MTLENVNFWGDANDLIQTLNKLKMCPITENDLDKDSILNVGILTSEYQGHYLKPMKCSIHMCNISSGHCVN